MKVREGMTVKISDIGHPAKVIKTNGNQKIALVEFDFPEGKVKSTIPTSIISHVLHGKATGSR